MAINYSGGSKTTKLFLKSTATYQLTNHQYYDGFESNGTWTGGNVRTSILTTRAPLESDFIDIGIITDEREEVAIGGLPLSLPFTSASARVYWAIGGKTIRVSLSGIIPDGVYVSDLSDGTNYNGKSNVSVFRFKMNQFFAYQAAFGGDVVPHQIQYRRKYLTERYNGDYSVLASTGTTHLEGVSDIPQWIMTSYSFGFVDGSRNMRYSLTLEMANNMIGSDWDVINGEGTMNAFGDIHTRQV